MRAQQLREAEWDLRPQRAADGLRNRLEENDIRSTRVMPSVVPIRLEPPEGGPATSPNPSPCSPPLAEERRAGVCSDWFRGQRLRDAVAAAICGEGGFKAFDRRADDAGGGIGGAFGGGHGEANDPL